MTEYLYVNIKTGAYLTYSKRHGTVRSCKWQPPKQETLTIVSSCVETFDSSFVQLAYHPVLMGRLKPGDLLRSQEWGDHFVVIAERSVFYQPIYTNAPRILFYTIQPLNGTRLPEPDETLNIESADADT